MRRYLPLILFIGLAWGEDLHLVSSNGKSITIKQAKYGFSGEIFYLNGIKYVLKDVNQKKKIIKVKKVYRTAISQLINYHKYQELPFDSIYAFRYIEQSFNIIPMLIGGGIGYYFLSHPEPGNFYVHPYWLVSASFLLGLDLSLVPRFSEKLIVGDGEWSVKVK